MYQNELYIGGIKNMATRQSLKGSSKYMML